MQVKRIALSKAKDDLSSVIRQAEHEEILITRHGRPAAVIVGFEDEDDWLEYQLLHDEGFLASIARARSDVDAGRFVDLESLDESISTDGPA
jgi:prevent-host-death family protein